jgi:hypothetical protein
MSDKDLAIRHKITSALAGLNSKEEEEEEQEDSAFSDESADDNSSDEDETVEPKVNIHKYKLFLLLAEKFRQKSPFYSKDQVYFHPFLEFWILNPLHHFFFPERFSIST